MPHSQSHVSAHRDILAADCSATSEEKPASEHFSVYMALRNPETLSTDTHLSLCNKHLAEVIVNKQPFYCSSGLEFLWEKEQNLVNLRKNAAYDLRLYFPPLFQSEH